MAWPPWFTIRTTTKMAITSDSNSEDNSIIKEEKKPESDLSIRSARDDEAAQGEKSQLAKAEEKPPVTKRRAREIFTFMMLMHFLLSMDMASIAIALPTIAKDMNASRIAVFSMSTVFFLTATVFQQPIAELSHAVGRKPAFLLVLFMFAVGSIVASTARDMTTLLVGRGLQGFASGGQVLTSVVLTDLIELKDRAIWVAVQNAVQALGLVLGPLIGAGLLKALNWRALLWINIPFIFISAVGLGFLLGFDRPPGGIWLNLRRLDWVGIAIFIPSAIALLSPFTMAGIFFAWNSWKALVPLSAGIIGIAVLALHQRYWTESPMFRSSLFQRWVTIFGFLGQASFGVCVNMILYYLIVFWSGVRGYDEVKTSVLLLPETITIPLAAILCGLRIRKTKQIRWAMFVGWPLTSLSIGLLWFLDKQTPLPVLVIINLGVGLGAGTIISALNCALLASTTNEDNGHAMAMAWLFKSGGMCLGIAIGTAVFTVQIEQRLGKHAEAAMTSQAMLRMLKEVHGDEGSQVVVVGALRVLWMICCGLSVVNGILCCSCKYPLLDRSWEGQQPEPDTEAVLPAEQPSIDDDKGSQSLRRRSNDSKGTPAKI